MQININGGCYTYMIIEQASSLNVDVDCYFKCQTVKAKLTLIVIGCDRCESSAANRMTVFSTYYIVFKWWRTYLLHFCFFKSVLNTTYTYIPIFQLECTVIFYLRLPALFILMFRQTVTFDI